MNIRDGKDESCPLRAKSHKPSFSAVGEADLSSLMVTGSRSNKRRFPSRHPQPVPPQLTFPSQLTLGPRISQSLYRKSANIVIRGTAKSLKPLPVKKDGKSETLSQSMCTEPRITAMSVGDSPHLCPPIPQVLGASKSTGIIRLLPLPKPTEMKLRSGSESSSICNTSKVFGYSKRISLHQRLDMKDNNVIIVTFEGVLGDVLKLNVWDHKPPLLHLRPGALIGVIKLLAKFQVILFITKPFVKAKTVLGYFRKHGVVFDGVYRSRNAVLPRLKTSEMGVIPNSMLKCTQCYEQIYRDFRLSDHASKLVLILSSLRLCEENSPVSRGTDLLYRQTSSLRREIYA